MIEEMSEGQRRRAARNVAAWCQRELDTARATGHLETRPLVQNVELIIEALREYATK